MLAAVVILATFVAFLLYQLYKTKAYSKSQQDALRQLTYILNNIGDAMMVIDQQGQITLANQAANQALGIPVVPCLFSQVIDHKQLNKTIRPAIKNAKSAILELELKGKTYFATVKPLPDTLLTMVVLSDITQAKEAQTQREEFFANASHELKTPLTAIKGFNELTAIKNKDESLDKYIQGITRETTRMVGLISNMLSFSQLKEGGALEKSHISLADIIAEIAQTLAPALEEKNIKFETHGNTTIYANYQHMYDMIKNLMENALRYNRPGGLVVVTIKKKKTYTRLKIKDTGIGISPKDQGKIFERFYRVDKSRDAKSGGTGLGLAIVKHICVLYGWRLGLKSKIGVGTEISVDFGE